MTLPESLFLLALAVILLNAAVVLLGLRNHARRQRTISTAPNVLRFCGRRGQLYDEVH